MGEAFQVAIEVGHKASTLKEPIDNYIYKWNLFLRSGDERQKIDKVVQKVVFNLHETFKNPVREFTQQPYCVKENGYGEFEFPIDIFFNGTSEKYTIIYLLDLPPADSFTPLNRVRREIITFVDPNPEFRNILIESGALKTSPSNSAKKKINSTSTNTSTNSSPNSLNTSKLNTSINGSTFLASHSAFPSEKKKNITKKSLIRNDLSSQNPKLASLQSTPIADTPNPTKPISTPTSTTPPKKLQQQNQIIRTITPNSELINETTKIQSTKTTSLKTLVKTKSKLNTINTNNDELDKLTTNKNDSNDLSLNSKKRPFVQSNESLIQNDNTKLDENKKILDELKFKRIKSNIQIKQSSPSQIEKKHNENEIDDESKIKKQNSKKFKNDLENLFSPLQSTLMTPPPSLNTNGTNSCTSSVSSSCNYNTSPSSLSSLCLNKEQTKLKTKSENGEKNDDYDKYDKHKKERKKNSSSSEEDDDEYRKDKNRRSSNSHHRRSYKRRNSNDYENDSDADNYYHSHYKNSHYRHHSRDRESKSRSSRNGNTSRKEDDETSSTVSTLSNSSNDKNYKKYITDNKKQPTNHNRDKSIKNLNDTTYRERMLNLYDKILFVHSNKQIDLLAKICGLVRPFSFTENHSFNFDLFTLDLNVIEKLESLVFESSSSSSKSHNGTTSSLDTSNKNKIKNKELTKT